MHGGVGTAYYTDSGYPAAHSYGHNNYHGAGQSVRKKRPANSGSRYLTDEENTLLFSMLGNDCISLAAGICQLYRADNGHWTRVVTGVIALVKDYNRRAYVLRMYNLDTQTLSWEQILYRLFQANYYPAVPRFLSFEGDQAVYGLSFAEESEATDFGHHLRKRYEAEQKSNKTHLAGSSAAPRPHRGYDTGITNSGAVTHVSSNTARRVDDKKEKKRKKEKKKLRKEDIGIPTNFQHKAHIGWDQDGGFNQQVFGDEPMDDSVRDLLRAAGHNPDSLKPEEIKFVYNFIENYKSGKNAEPAVSIPTHSVPLPDSFSTRTIAVIGNGRPSGQRPLPATPSMHPSNPLPAIPRHEHVPARPPPPPPPASQQPYHHAQPPPPPPPPVAPSNRTASLLPGSSHAPAPVSAAAPPPPPPPPPVSKPFKGTAPPPPPPPPPLPPNLINGGGNTKTESAPKPAAAPSGAPKDLLAEIQAGARLKPVGPPPERSLGKVVGGSTRDNMMEEIRQGANLKHVDQNAVAERRKSVSVQNLDGIAGALARALESRRNRMNQSDSEDEEANDSEWEDD